MTVFPVAQAWRQGRTASRRKSVATPFLLSLVTWFAGALPTWKRFRTATMQLMAFGFIDYAMFQWHLIAGCVAVGVSLLILEALGGEGK